MSLRLLSFRPTVRLSTAQFQRKTLASTARAMAGKQEWLFIVPDHAGALEKRMEVRPKHLEAIKPRVSTGIIPLGGATLDEPVKEGQPMKINGSAMIICADTREEALEVVKSDVYTESGVWDLSKLQVYPFKSAVRNAM